MYRLLIAEDELIERTVLRKTLLKKFEGQCCVYEAQNGKEALEIFRRERIQVVILDISMPVMSGIEAAEQMRKEDQNVCLIFLTAYDRFDYAKKAISVHAMEYLLKPYASREVISVVEEAFRIVGEGTGERPAAVVSDSVPETVQSEEEAYSRLSLMTSMVEEYIRTHYMRGISMHDAAAAVGYSEPYFCRMFKQQFGQSFTSYLTEYRIEEAKKLLAKPTVKVKEVGVLCGYPDSNYFIKVFRRATGKNPSEYRSEVFRQILE